MNLSLRIIVLSSVLAIPMSQALASGGPPLKSLKVDPCLNIIKGAPAVAIAVPDTAEVPDPSRESEGHDPSIGATKLHFDHVESQLHLLLFGGVSGGLFSPKIVGGKVSAAFSHIDENISGSYHRILSEYADDETANDQLIQSAEAKSLLGIHHDRFAPQVENGSTIVNTDEEYKGICKREDGVCHGLTELQGDFNYLADFAPELPRLKAEEEYLERIAKVLAGEPALFPGFKNLRELSEVPNFEFFMKLNIMDLWKSRAKQWSSIHIFENATHLMTHDEIEGTLQDIETRLARNEQVKIMFSSLIPSHVILGLNADIHVVNAYKVDRLPDGSIRLYIWDINFYAETLIREPKYIEIGPDKNIHYAPWYEATKPYAAQSDLLSRFIIAPDQNAKTAYVIKSLQKYYKAHPERRPK